ncbi:MAG: Dabb family protein [bacterium]|nr:Dabb family protein [bacterium]
MTRRIVATATLPDELGAADRQRVCEALERLGGLVSELSHSHAGLHVEGSVGGGDLTWDFAVPDPEALRELTTLLDTEGWAGLFRCAQADERACLARVEQIEGWLVEPVAANVPHADLVGIKRTNLVRVLDDAATDAVDRWQREVPVLADHVPAIRNWSLARVRAIGPTSPRVRWTHVWEQEFETLAGLLEDYMASPYHWGHLDGWYDVEMPHCIMDPDLAHLYCNAKQNVLSWMGTSA